MINYNAVLAHCPFTKQPFADCAVRVISGASIPKIIRYCMTDYALCPVYRKENESHLCGEVLNSNAI
jgi:hypothetical protein